jgi:cytochrome P450
VRMTQPIMNTFPPGPAPITSLPSQIQFSLKFSKDPIAYTRNLFETYGDTVYLRIGKEHVFFTTNPDHIRQVTVEHANVFPKNRDYTDPHKGLARFTGQGILTSNGDFWRKQRKIVAPSMHTRRIQTYGDTITTYTTEMVDGWQDGQRLKMADTMLKLTLRVIAQVLFNVDASAASGRVSEAMEVIQQASGGGNFSLLDMLPTWVPTPRELKARAALRDLDTLIYGIIDERLANPEDRGDLLSMLLMARDDEDQPMPRQQVRDEAVTMFLAGHETTANSMNWTWTLLARHPEVLAKLHHELDTVLAGRLPTYEDLPHLPYTEMIIKESMRLYPPAWSFSREAVEDVTLGEYTVPKGSTMGIINYFTHRDPRWWSDADTFRPERFAPEAEADLPKYAYIPFGAGPRICIGNAFAMMETRLILATVASRYTLHLDPGQVVGMKPLITLNPDGELPMTVRRREAVRPLPELLLEPSLAL